MNFLLGNVPLRHRCGFTELGYQSLVLFITFTLTLYSYPFVCKIWFNLLDQLLKHRVQHMSPEEQNFILKLFFQIVTLKKNSIWRKFEVSLFMDKKIRYKSLINLCMVLKKTLKQGRDKFDKQIILNRFNVNETY